MTDQSQTLSLEDMQQELARMQQQCAEFSNQVEILTTQIMINDGRYKQTNTELQGMRAELGSTITEVVRSLEDTTKVHEYVDNLLVGSVTPFATPETPEGWLPCDGREVNREEYQRLFGRIGTSFGEGDGHSTFHLPNLSGVFVRGWDQQGRVDYHREFGSYQADMMQSHTHKDTGHQHSGTTNYDGKHDHELKMSSGGAGSKSWGLEYDTSVGRPGGYTSFDTKESGSSHSHSFSTNTAFASLSEPVDCGTGEPRHGNENYPKNVALLYCIKY